MKTPSLLKDVRSSYTHGEKVPLGGYMALTAVFSCAFFALPLRNGKRLAAARSLSNRDLILSGIAAHKLSRLLTKDAVTSFARAPFTRYKKSLGYGEVSETPRLRGEMEAVSELASCTYCMSAWVALGMWWGWSAFPRRTRVATELLSTIAIADFLHVFYEEKRTRENVLTLQEDKLEKAA